MSSNDTSTASPNAGKTVFISGASRGIGRAIALQAAAAAYTVVVHYGSRQDAALQTLADIQAAGGQGRILGFDIADRRAAATALTQDIEAHGTYYGVVCNAGIALDNAFPSLTGEEWDSVIHTNLDGFYNILQPLIMPLVRRRKPGRIITLSSISGLVGNRGQVNYSASKAGIIGATKALAIEMAKRDITVNCVAPGIIETEMTAEIPREEVAAGIPMRRLGKPEEVAALVVFLLSDAASYITRQVISVNGGMV